MTRRPHHAHSGILLALSLGVVGCVGSLTLDDPLDHAATPDTSATDAADDTEDTTDTGAAEDVATDADVGDVGDVATDADTSPDTTATTDTATDTAVDTSLPVCGDGHVDPGEACDDGNVSDGDGCSADCQVETSCGPGVAACVLDADCPSDRCVNACCRDTTPPTTVAVSLQHFTMGSAASELGRRDDEQQREVDLSGELEVFIHEVTQSQWARMMGAGHPHFATCGANCPMETVSWWDALTYANALSEANGLIPCYTMTGCTGTAGLDLSCDSVEARSHLDCEGYRLPTEAEWEFLARGDSETAFYAGEITDPDGVDPVLSTIGWYDRNADGTPHPAGDLAANDFGLYDMSGNVWEWAWDGYAPYDPELVEDPVVDQGDGHRVVRGGSWNTFALVCRSAYRGSTPPETRNEFIGFRLVRTRR